MKSALKSQVIETPSWGYGNSGTRFRVFPQAGVPRDPFEKLADAAAVHAVTGVAAPVSLHIPRDRVADYGKLADHAAGLGVRVGMINSNTFQDEDCKLGSVCHPDVGVRRKVTPASANGPRPRLGSQTGIEPQLRRDKNAGSHPGCHGADRRRAALHVPAWSRRS
nr:hypothetical protein [Actinospica robiniae]